MFQDNLVERYRLLSVYNKHMRGFSIIFEPQKSVFREVAFFLIDIGLWFLKFFYVAAYPLLRKIQIQQTDIVVFSDCAIDTLRSGVLWKILESRGYSTERIFPEKIPLHQIITYQVKVDRKIPSRIFFHSLTAEFIVAKYNPSMICAFHSNNVMPSLLRLAASGKLRTIFIPHGVASDTIAYSSIDFDYYLAFGESTVNNIKQNPLRIGTTRMIKTGSLYVDQALKPTPVKAMNEFLFFSNWAIGRVENSTRDFLIVIEFARTHPEYHILIKLHPLESDKFVLKHASVLPNVNVLDKTVTLKEAIERAVLVITTVSNASIEAALMGRPTVIVNNKPFDINSTHSIHSDKYLRLEHFFLPRARDAWELHQRITEMLNNYEYFSGRCREFVNYHYERTYDSADYTAKILESILKGKEDFPYERMDEDILMLQ